MAETNAIVKKKPTKPNARNQRGAERITRRESMSTKTKMSSSSPVTCRAFARRIWTFTTRTAN
jgi:hypothetical protein